MRAILLLAAWSASALADGDLSEEASRGVLQAAESHVHELQRLHTTDALLEIQLRIAKKLQECRQTGYPCPGAELIPSPAEEESLAPTRTMDLPQLVGVYQGHAQLRLDSGQHVEVQAGQRLGSWRIHAVGVDSLEVLSPEGVRFRIPLTRTTP